MEGTPDGTSFDARNLEGSYGTPGREPWSGSRANLGQNVVLATHSLNSESITA
jgi:hypothetical protein